MSQVGLIRLLFILLVESLAQTGPIDICPTFYIKVVNIAQVPYGSNFASQITITIPLTPPQTSNTYQTAISYTSLSMPLIQDTVEIFAWMATPTTTSVNMIITGASSGISMQLLKISFLVIPSLYSNYVLITKKRVCISAACAFDFVLNPSTSVSLMNTYTNPLTAGLSYQVAGFITGFTVKSSYHPNTILGISLNVLLLNITHYSLNFTSVSSDPIRLKEYHATIIVFKTPSIDYGIKITTLTLSIPSYLTDSSISPFRTFYGISQYSFDNADFRFIIDLSGNNITKTGSANLLQLKILVISFEVGSCCTTTPFYNAAANNCVGSCQSNQYGEVLPGTISKMCQNCLYDCQTCNSSNTCTSCNLTTSFRSLNVKTLRCDPIKGYYDTGVAIALPCNYPNCCGDTPFTYNSSCVVTCPSGFVANASNVCVPCSLGYWQVSGYCTNVIGCVAATFVNDSVKCIFCKPSDHFLLQDQICICTQGYSLDMITGKCVEVCGDGINFFQKCDDNNTEDGDGCSSTCQTEDYFLCDSSSNYDPSQCAYIGYVQLTHNYANKTEGKNQGVFSFGFSTKRVKLNLAKIVSSFVFACNPRITTVMMSVTSTQVLLFVDYEQDLQGRIGNVTFNLNPKKVHYITSLSSSFLMISINEKLVVVHNYSVIINLKRAIEILSFIVIAIFGLASLTYKMIAVELLHSFLLVYFVCIETTIPTEPFLMFKNLRVIALNFEQTGNYYSKGSGLSYLYQNEEKTKLTLSILLVSSLAAGITEKIARQIMKSNAGEGTVKKLKILTIFRNTFYSLLFSLSIGYGYQSFGPNFVLKDNEKDKASLQIITGLVLFLAFCFIFLFFNEFVSSLWQMNCSKLLSQKCYIAFYLSFWLFIMSLLKVHAFYINNWLEQAFLACYVLFFLWFLCHHPYNAPIHNIGQGIYLITDIFFLSWSVGRKYFIKMRDEDMQINLSLALLFLMLVSLVLSVFRIINVIRFDLKPFQKRLQRTKPQKIPLIQNRQETNIKCERIEDAFLIENKYRIKSMLLSDELLEISNSMHHSVDAKWKRELLATLKQKYLIKDNQQADDRLTEERKSFV